jgi:hypothetical protein
MPSSANRRGLLGAMKGVGRILVVLFLAASAAGTMSRPVSSATQQPCEYWVEPAPAGNDQNPGTFAQPWATLAHAAEAALDNNCTILFKDGVYVGLNELERRFETLTTFKAVNDYKAILEGLGPVIELDGVKNMRFTGFEIRHAGPGADVTLMIMDRRDVVFWSEQIQFINNVIHDSYNNDLFKIHNGVRNLTIRGNVFYNQGESEEHLDVNGVTDVVITENIFFNDYLGSGRTISGDAKHYITIKDSNGLEDDQLGSARITVSGNIFLNWQGGFEAMVNVGNDGKPYYEASDVVISNNLMVGNSEIMLDAPVSIRGARNITFTNNTVTGDLPSRAFALRSSLTGQNLPNENLFFANNIWSDPTGTMGADPTGDLDDNDFATGDAEDTLNLVIDNNLYWNGVQPIPQEGLVDPLLVDGRALVADPRLAPAQGTVILPRWNGTTFVSGNQAIRQEFVRLVELYGKIPADSPAVGKADPALAPATDILGQPRTGSVNLGAYEITASGDQEPDPNLAPSVYIPLIAN